MGAERENCCFYKCDLHEACLVIAITSMTISAIELTLCAVAVVYDHWGLGSLLMPMQGQYLLVFTYVYMAVAALNIVASLLFSLGVVKLKHHLFLPWVLTTIAGMLLNIVFGLFGIAAITNNERDDIHYDNPTVIQLMFLYVAGQMMVVILRLNWIGVMAALFIEVRNKVKNDHKELL